MDLDLTEHAVDGHLVVEVRGEVDVHTAIELRDQLVQAIGSGQKSLVVDLSWLTFIDSTGLGALVAARNEAIEVGANLVLVCNSARLLKVFRITGLHEVFQIHPSVARALEDLAPN